jgi:hypothetical protein
MLSKIYQLDGEFEQTGEARCSIYRPNERHLHKYASETALDYAGTLSAVDGRTIVMVLAMSAGEYYGPNRNGDAWSEAPIRVGNQWAIAPGETLPDHHKTFEEHATVYKHHINKDPSNNYGDVLKSFYNWKMHRVELFLSVDNVKAHDIVGRINAGEHPGVSMGCRIKYDVCSICGHQAPTVSDYCHHVNGLDPRFGMNVLMPDGQRCFVWNPSPILFDISFVFRPADPIGFSAMKVAHTYDPYIIQTSATLGDRVENLSEKRAILRKMSDIDKIIEGDVVNPSDTPSMPPEEQVATRNLTNALRPALCDTPTLSMQATRTVAHHSLPEFSNSFFQMGMMPTAVELFRFCCAQAGRQSDPHVEHQLSQTQGKVASILSNTPQIFDQLADMGLLKIGSEYARYDIMDALEPMQEKRALWREYMARKYVPESIGTPLAEFGGWDADDAYYTPTWQSLHWQDPKSGKTYETTRRAAERADVSNKKKELAELAGVAGGLGVAYKVLTHRMPRAAAPLLLGSGGAMKMMSDSQKMPTVKTREGVDVPMNVEFVEKRSSALRRVGTPLAGGALLTAALLSERAAAEAPLEAQRALAVGRENPYKTWIGGTAAMSGLQHVLDTAKHAHYGDPTELDPVDISRLFLKIGAALLR